MSPAFEFIRTPTVEVLESLARRHPDNPFCTVAYVRAQEKLGLEACVLNLRASDATHSASCLGFLKKGRLTRSFDVPWLPAVPADSPFWPGLIAACKSMGVWDLTVRAFSPVPIPVLGAESGNEKGIEYRLDLTGTEPLVPPSSNHRLGISKARKEGVIVRRVSTPDAIATHLSLIHSSMERRAARGESVPDKFNPRFYEALLATGAAEFAQAMIGGVVASSIFVMRSAKGAYYQSAGTSPEGMSAGTSPFLIMELAGMLREEGVSVFDLGGAEPSNTGLSRFKAGFGGNETPFEIASFCIAHPLLRKLRTLINLLRHDRTALFRKFVALDRYNVFSTAPEDIEPPKPDPHTRAARLSDDELRELCRAKPEFHRQAERLDEFGFNDAYGVFVDGDLAHISWLVNADHDQLMAERDVKLREGEAEITHCHTAAAFRGQGMYPLALRFLCNLAASSSIKRVFIAAHPSNTASIRGITKAGLKPAGQIVHLRLPFLSKDRVLRWRGHR